MTTQLAVSLVAKLEGDIKVQLEAVDKRLGSIEASAKRAETAGKGLGTALTQAQGMLAAFGVQATFQGLIQGIRATINEFDHFRDLALQTGIAVQDIAGLDFAAKMSGGTGADDFLMMIRQTNKAIEEAQRNAGGPAAQAFMALSDAMKDASFNAQNLGEMAPVDRLQLLMNVVGKMKDTTDSSVIAQTLLGRSFMQVKGMAKDLGENGIDELKKAFNAMHPDIKATTERANEFNDKIIELKTNTSSWGLSAVSWIEKIGEAFGSAVYPDAYIDAYKKESSPESERAAMDKEIRDKANAQRRNDELIDAKLKTEAELAAIEARKQAAKAAADEARQEAQRAHDDIVSDTEAALKKELQKTVEGLNQIQAERMIHAQNLKDQGVISATELADYQVVMAEETAAAIKAIEDKRLKDFQAYMAEEVKVAKDMASARADAARAIADAEISGDSRRLSARHAGGKLTDLEAERAAYELETRAIAANHKALVDRMQALGATAEDKAEHIRLSGELAAAEKEAAAAADVHAEALEQLGGSARSGMAGVRAALKQMKSESENTFARMKELTENFAGSFKSGFADAFESFTSGTESAGQAFENFGMSMLKTIQRLAAEQLAMQIFSTFLSAAGGMFGGGTTAGAVASGPGASVGTPGNPFMGPPASLGGGASYAALPYKAAASTPNVTIVNNISAVNSQGVAELVGRKDFQDSQKNQLKGWFANDRGMRGSLRGGLG